MVQPAGDSLQKIRHGTDERRPRGPGGAAQLRSLAAAAVLGLAAAVLVFRRPRR